MINLKNVERLLYIFISTSMLSCTSNKLRIITSKEKEKYHLNGVINDAKICPTEFDEISKSHKVTGPCEIVSCNEQNNDIQCSAKPE